MSGYIGTIRSLAELNTFVKTGTVVGHQGRTSTRFSSQTTTSGGGGYLHNGSGYISAPTTTTNITSSSTHLQRYFVLEDDGDEFDIELPNVKFGVREGQRVSVICAGPKKTGNGHAVALVNQTIAQYQVFPTRMNWIISHRIRGYAVAAGGILLALTLIGYLVSGRIGQGIMPFAYLVGIGFVFWEVCRWQTVQKKVRLEIERIAQSTLDNGKPRAGA